MAKLTAEARLAQRGPCIDRMAADLAAMLRDEGGQARLIEETWQRGIASWGCGSVIITVRSDCIKAELDAAAEIAAPVVVV